MSTNSNIRIGIVAAKWHTELIDTMIKTATAEATAAGAEIAECVRVPGSYEMPLAADVLLEKNEIDAVVVLSCIFRGETLHGEVMGHVVHHALVNLQLVHRKPIGMGIIGRGASKEQMMARKDEYAGDAVKVALDMHAVLADARDENR
ncbi:MAG: 6,7-dimethyl-8-ribityllumazine synthase [Lentisphaeria bacterium]|nr:6,7-dimethyl-8-ribityllumazine synthase [Lentisphaeria bacterium]